MRPSWRSVLLSAAIAIAAAFAPATEAPAQSESAGRFSDGVVRIGLILDMSGPYSAVTGPGSAAAAQMAVEDFGGKVLGTPIEVLVADHRNSSDRAASIAREWFSQRQVDAIMDVSGSSEALLVQAIANTRHKIVSLSAPGAERLTNQACSPTAVHYVFDTHSIAHSIGAAMVSHGYNSWFFITVDTNFGYDLENDTTAVIKQSGGEVLGRARHPLDARDFSSYLARARESQAKGIAIANGGADMLGTIQQAAQLGMIPGPQVLAGLALRITLVHALGLETAQGLALSESFYWDMDDMTRAWSKRFFDRVKQMPNSLQAGVYSSTMHYLKAVASAGTDDTDAVMKIMRATPIDDFFAHNGRIREDGVMLHDTYVFQVKKPSESRHPWDYFTRVATIPGDQAFAPLSESKCPLIKR